MTTSLSHIWSACYFARSAGSFEHADDGLPSRFERHFAYVVAAIGAAGDFMDGTINELIQDARDDDPGGPTQHMTPAQRIALATTPSLADLRRRAVLDNYDSAASAAGVLAIARGLRIGQDADLLLAVKNALSHSVPETVTTVADEPSALTVQQMEQRLRILKLPRNPSPVQGNPSSRGWWPRIG